MISVDLILSGFILIVYSVVIIFWIKGWRKIPRENSECVQVGLNQSSNLKISVVICFKNEEIHLPDLIESLFHQSYKNFELIWVNDNSSDKSETIVFESLSRFTNARMLQTEGAGKKMSQKTGISSASGELIITTDADCVPGNDWISSIVSLYSFKPVSFIMGPVVFYAAQNLWIRLQRLEFISLVASGMASAGAGMPLYCNAANMAFTKKAWEKSLPELKTQYASGDDVFLLHSILKRGEEICVLKNPKAMVYTHASPDLKTFFHQRSRWLSKAPGYRNSNIHVIASLIAVVNLLLLYLMVISIFDPHYWIRFVVVFLGKYLMDSIFLAEVSGFFRQKNNLMMNLVLSVIYPFYVLFAGIGGIIKNKSSW